MTRRARSRVCIQAKKKPCVKSCSWIRPNWYGDSRFSPPFQHLFTALKDGSVKSSFFDYSAIHFDLRYTPGSFYVRADVDSRNLAGLHPGTQVVLKVTMTRLDMPQRETGEMTRVCSSSFKRPPAHTTQSYSLDMVTFRTHKSGYIPSKAVEGYECDVNGVIGCELCAI
jgi:hypothetical protein